VCALCSACVCVSVSACAVAALMNVGVKRGRDRYDSVEIERVERVCECVSV
jgi:hypothetical protein